MRKRPLSITIIGWLLCVLGVFVVVGALETMAMSDDPRMQKAIASSPLPFSVQVGFIVLTGILNVVCGAGVLRGQNWARWLYAGFAVFGLLVGLLTSPDKVMIIPGVLLQGTIILFLFLPKANAYFLKQ